MSKDEIKSAMKELELEKAKESYEKSKKVLKVVAGATGVMGAITVGGLLMPLATASVPLMGITLPGYFAGALGSGVVVTFYSKYMEEHKKIQEEKSKKAKEGKYSEDELFKLED